MSINLDIVFVAARRVETAVATKRDKFKQTTTRASIHGTTIGGIPAMNHFFNILDNSLSGMKNIYHFFIMV